MSINLGIIQVAHAPIRSAASDTAEMVTQLLFGESLEILEQQNQWIHIRATHDQYEGWMDSKQVFQGDLKTQEYWRKIASHRLLEHSVSFLTDQGQHVLYRGSLLPSDYVSGFNLGPIPFHPKEVNFALNRNHSVIEIAQSYLNAPYLWGGRSVTGIDCSGFTQMVFSFLGKALPRDASQQAKTGTSLDFTDVEAGDLAFFQNHAGRIIHVGMLTGQGTILHAHGTVTEDFMKSDGIYKKQDFSKSHELHSIRRM